MAKNTDVRPVALSLHYLTVPMRTPLKFGPEICAGVTFARVRLTVADRQGRRAHGWGETPLGVQWCWPSRLAYAPRLELMQRLCERLAPQWLALSEWGHPVELGHGFLETVLPGMVEQLNGEVNIGEPLPWLTGLICAAAFDLALHDAYGVLHGQPVYATYNAAFMNRDLAAFLEPAADAAVGFSGMYPQDFLVATPPARLPVWHLVGGVDPLVEADLTGKEPVDGYPVLLADWIRRDGLTCLKIKLCGVDQAWDYQRIVDVGHHANLDDEPLSGI